MGSPVTMTLVEIDSAIARNLMKWRRLTQSAAQALIGKGADAEQSDQSLDPHWFDREGYIVATAEVTESSDGVPSVWSPTRNPADAQRVRFKLAEMFQSIILARLAAGAIILFALLVNQPFESGPEKSHIATGISEEIATSLCALASVGIDAEIKQGEN